MLVINLSAFLWRVILFFKYRPVEGCDDAQLPTCTVIVPAYNEGSMVLKTLESVLQSDYPADKLQIIAIDDGSVDDTWTWMEKAAAESNGRIEAVRLIKNAGKRRALYEGFIRSKADVLVTIDSDSLIDPETIRCLVSPFVSDKKVGAVAGNVVVLNRQKDIIPRMLDVSFAFSFEFLRASQSVVNTVFCTPGALSAYRRQPVMRGFGRMAQPNLLGTAGENRRGPRHDQLDFENRLSCDLPIQRGRLYECAGSLQGTYAICFCGGREAMSAKHLRWGLLSLPSSAKPRLPGHG